MYIQKVKPGLYRVQVSWYDHNGKRHYKTLSGFKTKRSAQQKGIEFESAKNNHTITNQDPVFAEEFIKWAKLYKMPTASRGTQNRYLMIGRLLENNFGKTRLSDVTRADYQDFLNSYGKHRSKSTVIKTTGSISSFAKDCVADGLLQVNFTERVSPIWDKTKTVKVEYLSVKEIKELVASLLDGIEPKYISRYMILFAIYSGARIGEIRALTWSDIDFKTNTANITKSFDSVTQTIKEPKTESSNRAIKVNSKILDVVSQLKQNHTKYVFWSPTFGPPSSNAVNKTLRKHLKQLGINKKNFHFHSLRHSHVALLLYSGVDLYAISKRLGHASMVTTANKYAYLIDELKENANKIIVEVLDSLS